MEPKLFWYLEPEPKLWLKSEPEPKINNFGSATLIFGSGSGLVVVT